MGQQHTLVQDTLFGTRASELICDITSVRTLIFSMVGL